MQGKKHPLALTPKQKAYVKQRVIHPELAKQECAMVAGFSPRTAGAQIEKSVAVQNALTAALRRHGMDEDSLARKAVAMTEAKDTKFFAFEGHVVDQREVADNPVRLKAIELVSEFLGYRRNNNIENINIGLIGIPTVVDGGQWNQVQDAQESVATPSEKVA